jgi:BirA family biotin operon repressor/biotin-[acetyl-CoA-carboxylase] ligase
MQPVIKIFKKRLKSTNLYASGLVAKSRRESPFWIRTDNQFAGKGQGNLTGSLVIFPERFNGSDQFSLSMILALSMTDFLGLFIEDIEIKWPNDLYTGGKKIGGILIETAIMGSSVDHAIMGIGININQEAFPDDIPDPVSLTRLTGMKYDLVVLEDLLLEVFRNRYTMIESGNLEGIREDYLKKMYRFNQFADYQADNKKFIARIKGINEFGHLILENKRGLSRSFAFQEVTYLG